MKYGLCLVAIIFLSQTTAATTAAQVAPTADHHQHVFSPDMVKLLAPPPGWPTQISASDVVAELNRAGIRRGLVLSVSALAGLTPAFPPSQPSLSAD